jgi:CHAT domain-containing protein/Flp pilus assembly protein TadD
MLKTLHQLWATPTLIRRIGPWALQLTYLLACLILVLCFANSSRADFLNNSTKEIHARFTTQAEFGVGLKLNVVKLFSCFEQDPNLIAGTEALQAGQKLDAENTREAHLKAIEKYAEAARIFHTSKIRLGEAVALMATATSYSSLNLWTKALDYAKQALPLIDSEETDPTILATTLNIIGAAYSSTGEQQKALEYFNRALPLALRENNPAVVAPTLTGMGTAYAYLGERQKAAEYFDKSLTLFRNANDPSGEATTLTASAALYHKLGEPKKALDLFNQALPLMRKTQNPAGEANALSGIGGIYSSLGDKQKAIDFYKQALAVISQLGSTSTEATALNNLGEVYSDLGDKVTALDYFNRSLKISRDIEGAKGGADSLNNIGALYVSTSEYQKALDSYFKALATAEADNDISAKASILDNIGVVYLYLQENRKALGYFLQALPVFQYIGDRQSEASTVNLIGTVYESIGEKQNALDSYNRALSLGRAVQDPSVEANALSHIGQLNAASGQNLIALENYNQVLSLMRSAGKRDDQPTVLHNIGSLYQSSKDYGKALEFYKDALSLQQAQQNRQGQVSTLANIGSVYEEQQKLDTALDYFRQAIEIQEKIRTEARLEEFKIKLSERSLNVYFDPILLNMRLGRFAEAFDLSEKARARAFLDQIGNSRLDIRKGADDQLVKKDQMLRAELGSLERQLNTERAKSKVLSDPQAIELLEKRLLTKRVEYEDFLTDLKIRNPEYASIFSVDSLNLAGVQKLLEPETTLVSYLVTLNSTLAFVITRDSFKAISIPIKGDDISKQIIQFRGFANLDDPYPQSLKELYRILIAPIEPFVKTRRVGIVSHNVLHYLPFSALLKGQRYFGDDHEIFYLPSASVLAFMQTKRKPAGESLLALAQGQSEGLPFLQYAGKSAQEVASLYRTEALVDTAATETAFRDRVTRSSIVFVAAHGKLNTVTPLFSRIFLAADESNDGLLEVHEIYGLDLKNVNLVVLSGCETELGERSQGDDIIGLNRAFMYAGTSTVVASLWSVKEVQTGELMGSFFKSLKQGLSKSEALQRAQQEIRTKYPHPYYWAAFVLTGDPGTPRINSAFLQ